MTVAQDTIVTLKHDVTDPVQGMVVGGASFRVEGLWTELTGKSWKQSADEGNPAAVQYLVRRAANSLPSDDNVYYGKIGAFGNLVHATEIVTS